MTYGVVQQIEFCYGHRLFGYQGKCAHPHGHNAVAHITIESKNINSNGMVVDFTEIKKILQSWIDETLDHRMILHKDDPLVAALEKLGEPIVKIDTAPTVEYIAQMIFEYAQKKNFPVQEVRLWGSPSHCAYYRG